MDNTIDSLLLEIENFLNEDKINISEKIRKRKNINLQIKNNRQNKTSLLNEATPRERMKRRKRKTPTVKTSVLDKLFKPGDLTKIQLDLLVDQYVNDFIKKEVSPVIGKPSAGQVANIEPMIRANTGWSVLSSTDDFTELMRKFNIPVYDVNNPPDPLLEPREPRTPTGPAGRMPAAYPGDVALPARSSRRPEGPPLAVPGTGDPMTYELDPGIRRQRASGRVFPGPSPEEIARGVPAESPGRVRAGERVVDLQKRKKLFEEALNAFRNTGIYERGDTLFINPDGRVAIGKNSTGSVIVIDNFEDFTRRLATEGQEFLKDFKPQYALGGTPGEMLNNHVIPRASGYTGEQDRPAGRARIPRAAADPGPYDARQQKKIWDEIFQQFGVRGAGQETGATPRKPALRPSLSKPFLFFPRGAQGVVQSSKGLWKDIISFSEARGLASLIPPDWQYFESFRTLPNDEIQGVIDNIIKKIGAKTDPTDFEEFARVLIGQPADIINVPTTEARWKSIRSGLGRLAQNVSDAIDESRYLWTTGHYGAALGLTSSDLAKWEAAIKSDPELEKMFNKLLGQDDWTGINKLMAGFFGYAEPSLPEGPKAGGAGRGILGWQAGSGPYPAELDDHYNKALRVLQQDDVLKAARTSLLMQLFSNVVDAGGNLQLPEVLTPKQQSQLTKIINDIPEEDLKTMFGDSARARQQLLDFDSWKPQDLFSSFNELLVKDIIAPVREPILDFIRSSKWYTGKGALAIESMIKFFKGLAKVLRPLTILLKWTLLKPLVGVWKHKGKIILGFALFLLLSNFQKCYAAGFDEITSTGMATFATFVDWADVTPVMGPLKLTMEAILIPKNCTNIGVYSIGTIFIETIIAQQEGRDVCDILSTDDSAAEMLSRGERDISDISADKARELKLQCAVYQREKIKKEPIFNDMIKKFNELIKIGAKRRLVPVPDKQAKDLAYFFGYEWDSQEKAWLSRGSSILAAPGGAGATACKELAKLGVKLPKIAGKASGYYDASGITFEKDPDAPPGYTGAMEEACIPIKKNILAKSINLKILKEQKNKIESKKSIKIKIKT